MAMSKPAVITAIRLLGFHNFTDVTLELPAGGHLFLLGDNGCGKTTVLDAIHYVLTGGEVEFNAAARVGSKIQGDGRRAQGIILRINTEARSEQCPDGALNPQGGISYAALQILDSITNRSTVIGIGMRASSMNEDLTRWGFIKTGTLDTVPLYEDDDTGRHPFDEHELRDRLGTAVYLRIGDYRRELARKFFNNEDTYRDICDLLATGKAYKEIVASTRNYDERFRRLLRVPDRELFSKVVVKLREIHASKAELDGMEETVALLKTLVDGRTKLRSLIETRLCAMYASCCRQRTQDEAQLKALAEEVKAISQEQATCIEKREAIEARIATIDETIRQLEAKDPAGLEATLEREQQEERRYDKIRGQAGTAHKRACDTLVAEQKTLKDAETALVRFRQTLGHERGFSADLRAALENQDSLEQILTSEGQRLVVRQGRVYGELAQAKYSVTLAETALSEAQEVVEATRKRLLPDLPNYAQALDELTEAMTGAQPLYELLEPSPVVSPSELARFEQACGEAALSVFVVSPEQGEVVRAKLFKSYPNLALTILDPDAPTPDVASWFKKMFSPDCDPLAIHALWRQMVAERPPERVKSAIKDNGIIYRGIEAKEGARVPQWIGTQTREIVQARRIQEAEEKLRQCERALKNAKDQYVLAEDERTAIERAQTTLETYRTQRGKVEADLHTAKYRVASATERREQTHHALVQAEEILEECAVRVRGLRQKVKAEGLEGLHRQVVEKRKQRKDLSEERDRLLREDTTLGNRLTFIAHRHNELLDRIRQSEAQSSALLPQLSEQALTVFRAQTGADENLIDLIQRFDCDIAQLRGRLHEKVTSGEAASFGFRLNEDLTLTDHRGTDASDILAERSTALDRQLRLLNEKNRELFQDILLNELSDAMALQVSRLHMMSTRISRLLKESHFGASSYDFKISPLKEYEAVVHAIRHPNDPNASETLRAFLARHQDAIHNTPSGEVPEVLDYRNWFRYELRIGTVDGNNLTMDRRLKSIGSGGEQAVPNYLLILAGAAFLYDSDNVKLAPLLFDEAFYGIDAGRRDSLMAFADKLGLQIFVASPDQDGVRASIHASTTLLVVKDTDFNIHLTPLHWDTTPQQEGLGL